MDLITYALCKRYINTRLEDYKTELTEEDYEKIAEKITLVEKTSELENDSGFISIIKVNGVQVEPEEDGSINLAIDEVEGDTDWGILGDDSTTSEDGDTEWGVLGG